MPNFDLKWSVREIVNGVGQHDDGVRDGDSTILASGQIVRQAESAEALRAELTGVLEKTFPAHALGPTYDLDRVYDIEIRAL